MDETRFSLLGRLTPTDWIAVAIQQVQPHCRMHAGLLYRDANDDWWYLHFAFHEILKTVEYTADGTTSCATTKIDEADQVFLAAFCGRVSTAWQNQEIPYNLKYDPDVRFDPTTGAVSFGPNSTGLNCATFVLAVFRSAGNPLIDATGWPADRPGDRERQTQYVEFLRQRDVDHADVVEAEIGTPRIRPEEAAGACLEDDLPAGFAQCEPNGRYVLQEMAVT